MLKIPPKISIVISVLESRGHQAYIVGGCVRDMLLGKTPNDFDVTTSANPDEVMEIFEKTVPTGINIGVSISPWSVINLPALALLFKSVCCN